MFFRKHRIACAAMLLTFVLGSVTPALAATFTDVPDGHWAASYVERAADAGWVNGIGDGSFAPDSSVTSAEYTALVTRAFYGNTLKANTDNMEADEWWYPVMETGYMKGILAGTTCIVPRDSEEYEWNDTVTAPITRYDMAQVAYNVMVGNGKAPAADKVKEAQGKVADWSSIPENYQQAVAACYATGVLTGIDDVGTFGGINAMTRAQSAVILCRLADL